jgi:hypothetical protein
MSQPQSFPSYTTKWMPNALYYKTILLIIIMKNNSYEEKAMCYQQKPILHSNNDSRGP